MRIISVRDKPEYKDIAIKYLQQSWSEISPIIYENCISNCINANQFLPSMVFIGKESRNNWLRGVNNKRLYKQNGFISLDLCNICCGKP